MESQKVARKRERCSKTMQKKKLTNRKIGMSRNNREKMAVTKPSFERNYNKEYMPYILVQLSSK